MREWEDWAKGEARHGPGVKRARVQVLVQGEGGRLIKKENWLVGLRDGEYLAYSVSVNRCEDDTDAPDPNAASSGGGASAVVAMNEETNEESETEHRHPEGEGLLPVTGEDTPDVWNAVNRSRPRDFSVDDFMQTALADKFYQAWKKGEVTDNLIGRRFGYGVLGGFYGRRGWESGVFRDQEPAGGPDCEEGGDADRGGKDTPGASASEKPMMGAGQEPEAGCVGGSVAHADGALAVQIEPGHGAASGDPSSAASLAGVSSEHGLGHEPVAGEPSASTSLTGTPSERDTEGSSVRVGSRQLSLAHWLL